jgi:hypothetical protein
VRAWLYQITTTACLRLISRRPRRILSPDYGPPRRNTDDLGDPVTGPIWLEPWPDDEPVGAPGAVDPAARCLRRESVEHVRAPGSGHWGSSEAPEPARTCCKAATWRSNAARPALLSLAEVRGRLPTKPLRIST